MTKTAMMMTLPTTDRISSRSNLCRLALVLSVGLLLLALLPKPSVAQAGLELAHDYTYGQVARFTAAFPEEATFTDIRLFLRIPRSSLSDTQLYEPVVSEGLAVYERDLRLNPFPPYASLTYWWVFTDAEGAPRQTDPVTFLYEDNRYAWQELQEGGLTIRWVAGTPERMVAALDVAREAANNITSQLRITDLITTSFYIYPSTADLHVAMRLTGHEWLAGMTLPEVGVVLLAIPSNEGAFTQMQTDIPHELTHQILYSHFGHSGYYAIPTWLVEGLASAFELRQDANRSLLLEQAQQDGQLLPLGNLCVPFYSLDTAQLRLAYAESYSAVTYLQSVYGWSGVRALLQTYADGRECSVGMKHALGIDLPTFEREWRTWLVQGERVTAGGQQRWAAVLLVLRDLAPWLVLAGLLILPSILAFLHPRISRTALQR